MMPTDESPDSTEVSVKVDQTGAKGPDEGEFGTRDAEADALKTTDKVEETRTTETEVVPKTAEES